MADIRRRKGEDDDDDEKQQKVSSGDTSDHVRENDYLIFVITFIH